MTSRDVEPLVEKVRERRATSIHLEELRSWDKDAAIALEDQLPSAVRSSGTLYVHVAKAPSPRRLRMWASQISESGGLRPCQLDYV
jgi:hypothetical protein